MIDDFIYGEKPPGSAAGHGRPHEMPHRSDLLGSGAIHHADMATPLSHTKKFRKGSRNIGCCFKRPCTSDQIVSTVFKRQLFYG